MALSTRNRLPGTITDVVKGEAAAKVGMEVEGNKMVALITRESADELGLEAGQRVTALVKATDVMIQTEDGGVLENHPNFREFDFQALRWIKARRKEEGRGCPTPRPPRGGPRSLGEEVLEVTLLLLGLTLPLVRAALPLGALVAR